MHHLLNMAYGDIASMFSAPIASTALLYFTQTAQ
jgi:hypothetical protein